MRMLVVVETREGRHRGVLLLLVMVLVFCYPDSH
jgi:hypothetical protein